MFHFIGRIYSIFYTSIQIERPSWWNVVLTSTSDTDCGFKGFFILFFFPFRSVTDPRDGKRVALKKMPNVFQNLVSCKRVFRELKMLCFFKHENVSTFVCTNAWIHMSRCHGLYQPIKRPVGSTNTHVRSCLSGLNNTTSPPNGQ